MPERNDFLDRHAPVQHLADKMKAERARTCLTMSEHGTFRFSDHCLKRPHVGFSDRVHGDRNESIGKITLMGCIAFGPVSGLICILTIGTVVDECFEAAAMQRTEFLPIQLRRYR